MGEPITYAKAGGPPDDWHGLQVLDLATGEQVLDVVEVNAIAGWLIRYVRSADGCFAIDGDQFATERIIGRFACIRHPRYS